MRNLMYFAQILFILLLLVSCQTEPEKLPDEIISGPIGQKLEDELTPYIRRIMIDHKCVSVAIGVTKGTEIIYAKAFGFEDIETRKEASIHTVYHMASISKPFVATAILQLAEKGKLSLDDPVVKYLPYFKLAENGHETVTIRHLLTHTSGLPITTGSYDWENPSFGEDALEKYVRSIAGEKLLFPSGSQFTYSNPGFECLGNVIAKVSGMSFEDYMQHHVLNPTGMRASTYSKPDYLPDNWAAAHLLRLSTERWQHYPYNRKHAPSSTLHSNVVDMCKWGIINLNYSKLNQLEILKPSTFARLFQPEFDTPWGGKIGLGWFLQEYAGKKTILHNGEDTGFETQLILYPEEEISIVVMANRNSSRTARIANATIEVILDLGIKDYKVSGRFPFGDQMAKNGIDSAKVLWHKLKSDSADRYQTGEYVLNTLGHSLIEADKFELAKEVFQFNIDEFPESPNVYDSFGDALLAEGDTLNAIRYFKKSLAVDPDFEDPKPKLIKLGVN
ncbi:MAG: serine hydrolase [Calditrichaeota bacterium]|nr:serine hydrolase [Calditrichota bacterium]MCB0268041.1 serine hydrolase [Calditrichota bacterium]